ncbi:MAG: glycosyltransferase family 4 protein [Thermoleophilia bacterium]
MRVLLDCRMASWSGVGRYTTGLVRALAVRDDVQIVQVCAAGTDLPVELGPRVEVVFVEQGPFSLRGALELGRLARRVQPDLVHCLHFPTPLPAPVSCPLVVTLHDLTPLVAPRVMPSLIKRAVYRRYNARAARVADRIIVPSRATAATVGRLFPAARRKLVFTAEAADDFSSGSAGPLSPHLAALTSTPYLLAMGNTKGHKDVPTLLRAFARLGSAGADVGLLLVGAEVPGYAEAVLAGVPADVRGRVAFTGHVSDAELRVLYAGATTFVSPSRHEGFGLPPLEAMALGAPVVCAAASSLPEVVGDAAVLFPAGNAEALAAALRSVLGDDVLRQRLRQAGRERAAQFTWQRTAAATVTIYHEALAHFRIRQA